MLQQRVLPEMLFQGKVSEAAQPLVVEIMRLQLGRELESSLLGREVRAWLHLLAHSPASLQAATVQTLLDACERRRWQEASNRVEEALVRAMEQARPSGSEADSWVQMLAQRSGRRPQLWQTLSEQTLSELGWEASKLALEALCEQRGWTPAMLALLIRWLLDPERGLEMARLAIHRGWPVSEEQRWSVWIAGVVKADTDGAVHEAIVRLQAHVAEATTPAPEPQQRQLEQWIRSQSAIWIRSRRQRRGIVAAAALWQAAQSYRAKWSDEGLLDALLQGLWAHALESWSAGSSTRAMVVPELPGVEERELQGALLRAILRASGQFPHLERMPGAVLLQVARHHPELLRELLRGPGIGVKAALQALTIEERRAVWQPLLRSLSAAELFEVAEQTGMLAPLEAGTPAASPEWLETWRPILERVEDRHLEQGWIELCGRSVGLLMRDPTSTPVLETALGGCGRILVLHLLAVEMYGIRQAEQESGASSSRSGVDEDSLWETLRTLCQALALRGRVLTIDPMHLALFLKVLSERIVSKPATLALTLARARLIEPGLAAAILVQVLRRQQVAGPSGLHGLLGLVRGSTEVFRVLIAEPEEGRIDVVKQVLRAVQTLLRDPSEQSLERAALSSVVPCWMVCIPSIQLDAELLDGLERVQQATLEAIESQREVDLAERRIGLSPLSILMVREVRVGRADSSDSSGTVMSGEVLIEMSFSAMARIAGYLCRDLGRRHHMQQMRERLQRLADGPEGPLALGAARLGAVLAALSWGMYGECGSVAEERELRLQTRRALEEVSTMHGVLRERVARGMCEAAQVRIQGVELEQTLALRVLAIFWTTATGHTTWLPELVRDLDNIDWSCHPEVVEEAAEIMASAWVGYSDLCRADGPIRNLWSQLEKAERPLLLDQVMLDYGACLAGELGGIRPWLEMLERANRRLEQEAGGAGPVSYQQELARALLLRSTVRATSIVATEIEQICPDEPELHREVMAISQSYLDQLVELESTASERVPELLFAIFRQHLSGFVGLGDQRGPLQHSANVSAEEQLRCRDTLGRSLPVLAKALTRLKSGPRLIRAYSKVTEWEERPVFRAHLAQMPWAEQLSDRLMARIQDEYAQLYVRAELETLANELPENSALTELLGLAGPLLEIPLRDEQALQLLGMYGAWLGSVGQRAPMLEERFVTPQVRQIGGRLSAWLMAWKPDSADYSLLEMLAVVPDATLQRALKQWCAHHRGSLKGRKQKAQFVELETRIHRRVELTQRIAIQAAEAMGQRETGAAAASGSAASPPASGPRKR